MKPKFTAGKNIAIKVPSHEYDRTVSFYQDVLGFETIETEGESINSLVYFKFGDKNLWIDKMPGLSQAEIWLEIVTDDVDSAKKYLANQDCIQRDEIEILPNDLDGFWVSNPANIIHLIDREKDEE